MTDDNAGGQFSFKRQFPALRLTEVPGLALSPVAIIIAILASVLISLSGWLVDEILPAEKSDDRTSVFQVGGLYVPDVRDVEFGAHFEIIARPLLSVIQPVTQVLSSSAGIVFRLNPLVKFAFALGIWSLAGGFLCRHSAFRFGFDDEKTFPSIFQYSIKRWLASLGSPLIPLSLALLLALIVAGFGFVSQLPLLGSLGLYLGSPVFLIFGFVMAFLLLATAFSWPLMVAAVAIDDCESFGGLSRAYSSLTGRPWHFLGYWLVSLILGQIFIMAVYIFQSVAVWCVLSSLEIGGNTETIRQSMLVPLNALIIFLVSGIGISYFWSAATVIYLLIRLEIDGVPLERIAPDDADRPVRDPLPVVGIPATDASPNSNGVASSGNPADVL